MKKTKPWLICSVLLALVLPSLSCLPVYGATSKKTVSSVRLNVDCKKQPEAGQKIETVTVTTSTAQAEILEPAEYFDTEDNEVWIRGEVPLIRVTLAVKDSGQYRFTSSTKVIVSGFQSDVKSKKVQNGGETLDVEIRLKRVGGDLDSVYDCYWNGSSAAWSEVEYADKYEVKLYRGTSLVTTVTAMDNQYYFYPYMTKTGAYRFKVRPLSTYDGGRGPWSERSEEYYLTPEHVYTGPAPSGSSGSGWVQDTYGWTYHFSNGQLARSSWLNTDNNWFYLGDDGYMKTNWLYTDNNWFYLNPVSDGTRGAMKTGWLYTDNNWFYLNPVSDGTRGAMKTGWLYADSNWFYLNPVSDGTRGAMRTGWQNINGKYYYLNPVSDGTRGAMRTGYQQISGVWYFLDTGSGELWVNRRTPDGRWADGSGAVS